MGVQSTNFKSAARVNYEDPNLNVDMPIFSIHGNHDDPTREGGMESLSAMDLLATCGLVNYFGAHDNLDDICVSPVLLRKGTAGLALYGLGHIKDDRLNRAFVQNKVRWELPETGVDGKVICRLGDADGDDEDGAACGDWFNLLVVHQNRETGRGAKNCLHNRYALLIFSFSSEPARLVGTWPSLPR